MKRPEYQLSAPVMVKSKSGEVITLPVDSFIQLLYADYVPDYVKEKNPFFNKKLEQYCATQYGIFAVPKASIREAY